MRENFWLIIYVDNIIIMYSDEESISWVKKEISTLLDAKNMGTLSKFLGLTFVYNEIESFLHQQDYAIDVLRLFGM